RPGDEDDGGDPRVGTREDRARDGAAAGARPLATMARPVPVGVAAGWDPRFTRMVGVSACAHVALLAFVLVVLPRLHPAPPVLTGYRVELTDPSALGGKPPPGRPDQPLGPRPGPSATEEAAARAGEPAAKPEPPPPPPPSEAAKPEPAPKPPEPAKE